MLSKTAARLRAVRMGHRAAGFSLIEVLVGATLTAIVGAIGAMFLIGSTGQANRIAEQSLGAGDARVAVERISTLLRVADTPTARPGFATGRFEVMSPQRVVFYANVDTSSRAAAAVRTPPTKYDIYVSGGKLWEKSYPPKTRYTTYPSPYDYTSNYATTPTTTRVLLDTVLSSQDTVVFSYCTAATDPSVTCTAASSAPSISSIGIELTVPGSAGRSPQVIDSTVAITGALS